MLNIESLMANSEPWLQYAIKRNLLNEKKEDLAALCAEALQDEKIRILLSGLSDFHAVPIRSHKNADLPIHRLLFALDCGFDTSVPEIQSAVSEIVKHKDRNGVYQSVVNVPTHFGGNGQDAFCWCLCDAPLLLLALLKAGVDYEKYLKQGVDFLASLSQNQGYLCAASPELGKFRGPGRKDECCPYATLIMLRLFSEIPEYQNSETAHLSINGLLSLWENSLQSHPYLFYMGTDFRKLKAPSLWYDIVSVADVLSRFDSAKRDKRFLEMRSVIKGKQNENGFFTPESVYQKYAGWDFGQKKLPSPYLTYLCATIFRRME